VVGHRDQVLQPGDYFTTRLIDEPLLIVAAPTIGCALSTTSAATAPGPPAEGCGSHKLFRCRYHGWTYNLDGSLNHALKSKAWKVQAGRFRACARVLRGVVQPCLRESGPNAQPLVKSLGELPQQAERFPFPGMKLFERRAYDMNATGRRTWNKLSRGLPSAHRPPRLSTANSTSTPTPSNPAPATSASGSPIRGAQPGDETPRRYQEARDGLTPITSGPSPTDAELLPDNVSLNMILPLEPERHSGYLSSFIFRKRIWAAETRPRVCPVQRRDSTRRRRHL